MRAACSCVRDVKTAWAATTAGGGDFALACYALFMSAIVARIPALFGGLLALVAGLLGLPDLDQIRRLLERIQEMLALGGMAFALLISLGFTFFSILIN